MFDFEDSDDECNEHEVSPQKQKQKRIEELKHLLNKYLNVANPKRYFKEKFPDNENEDENYFFFNLFFGNQIDKEVFKENGNYSAMDLFSIDIGEFYAFIYAEYPDLRIIIKYILTILGMNLSQSFCERMVSYAQNISTKKNTRLSDDKINEMAVLRINKNFIEETMYKKKIH